MSTKLKGTGKQRARVRKAERRLMRAIKSEATRSTSFGRTAAATEGHKAALAVVNIRQAMR